MQFSVDLFCINNTVDNKIINLLFMHVYYKHINLLKALITLGPYINGHLFQKGHFVWRSSCSCVFTFVHFFAMYFSKFIKFLLCFLFAFGYFVEVSSEELTKKALMFKNIVILPSIPCQPHQRRVRDRCVDVDIY